MSMKLLGNLERGLIFVISAPAGTGKTTLTNMLVKEFPCLIQSVAYTTRKPREGEIAGVHYNYITKDEFQHRIAQNDLLEYAEIYGDYYGTSNAWVDEQLQKGKHVLLVIDTQGALKVQNKREATLIFIRPPSLDELRQRLTLRRTETADMIEKRLEWAKHELQASKNYDYILVNENLEEAYQILRSILIAQEYKNK